MPLRRRKSIAASRLVPFVLLLCCGTAAADPVVAREVGRFYAAFLGRELRPAELRTLTDEYIEIHGAMGKSRDAIRETARWLGGQAKVLRKDPDGPAAYTLRHIAVELNYFDPALQGKLHLRLLTTPDPVRVVDRRSRRLMTERDVIALANIRHFSRSEGPPRHRDPSRRQIEELVAGLNAAVGGDSGAMPRFFGETAAFWAGVKKAWPELDAEQRTLARAYAGKMWRIQIPPRMYGLLWGLEPRAATSRYADDVSDRLAGITDINMRLGNLPRVMDAIFGP